MVAGDDEQGDPAGQREGDPGDDHQERAGDQHAPATEPVGVGRQPQRDHRVADQRERQDDADRDGVEPDGGQVQDQDDRQEPVAEHPEDPRREQQAAVAVEATEAGDQPGLGWPGHPQGTVPGARRWAVSLSSRIRASDGPTPCSKRRTVRFA